MRYEDYHRAVTAAVLEGVQPAPTTPHSASATSTATRPASASAGATGRKVRAGRDEGSPVDGFGQIEEAIAVLSRTYRDQARSRRGKEAPSARSVAESARRLLSLRPSVSDRRAPPVLSAAHSSSSPSARSSRSTLTTPVRPARSTRRTASASPNSPNVAPTRLSFGSAANDGRDELDHVATVQVSSDFRGMRRLRKKPESKK